MRKLIKLLWIPMVTSLSVIVIFIFLKIILGVFIALFESDWLMYIWYELYLASIVGAAVAIKKHLTKLIRNIKLLIM